MLCRQLDLIITEYFGQLRVKTVVLYLNVSGSEGTENWLVI